MDENLGVFQFIWRGLNGQLVAKSQKPSPYKWPSVNIFGKKLPSREPSLLFECAKRYAVGILDLY